MMQTFPPCPAWAIVRTWLQSAYILQTSEFMSSFNPVELFSRMPFEHAAYVLLRVEITVVNQTTSSDLG